MATRPLQSARDVLPLSDPERTIALCLVRWSDAPDDPLRISLDFSLLDRLGWRPGDRITFEPVPLDRVSRQGGLVIRPAARNEPAIKLRRDQYLRRPNQYAPHFPDGPDGPDIHWPFPSEWIETFFPQKYLPGPGPPVFVEPERTWLLGKLPDHPGRLLVPLNCAYLEFYLQRTDPSSPSLDVHLPAGVLHLMGWTPATHLALASAVNFDPSAPEDVLTVRRVPLAESNLRWDGGRFIASPGPAWLERYFPGLHDNTELLPEWPSPDTPATAGEDGDFDLLKLPGPAPSDEDFSFHDGRRDTFCVYFRSFRLGPGSLSFAIPGTSDPWE